MADQARRDPITRHLIDPDGTSLGRRMVASGTSDMIRAEFWDPFLDAAFTNHELPRGLPRSDVYLWLRSLALMFMSGLEDSDADLGRYRSILRRFVPPAFASSNAQVSA